MTAENWLLEVDFNLTPIEWREGIKAYRNHKFGGRIIVVILTVAAVAGCVLMATSCMPGELLHGWGIESDPGDRLTQAIYGAAMLLFGGGLLVLPFVSVKPVLRLGDCGTLRWNEFDVEVESGGIRRRWGWPEFWVFKERAEAFALMRQRLLLIIPKRIVPLEMQGWFRLMAEDSTSPRRDMRREFEVIMDHKPAHQSNEGEQKQG